MKAAIDTTVDLEVDLHVHRMHKIAFLHDYNVSNNVPRIFSGQAKPKKISRGRGGGTPLGGTRNESETTETETAPQH